MDVGRRAKSRRPRPPRVVIVGAGFGGLAAARALGRARADVTIVDRRNHHLFQPLLYQVATAGLSPANIAYPIRSALRGNANTRVVLDEVTAVDLAARELVMRSESIAYDFLILATGASHSYFGHREWERSAPGLKSLEDALEIRRRILLAFELAERESDPAARRALMTFVIVGAGPTGVELAGAIAEIACHVMANDFRRIDPCETRVLLVEAGPRILPAFAEELAIKAQRALEHRGVEVRTNSRVTAVESESVVVGGETIAVRTVLWAAGVAASQLGNSLGVALDRAGRVPVKPELTLEEHPEVFVIGDLAAFVGPDGRPLPGLAPVAIQQGRHAARNIMNRLAGRPYEPFRYRDKGKLATIGRSAAIAEFGRIRLSGFVAWLLWSLMHIAYLIGFRNRVVVMLEWAWAYFSYERGARLITGAMSERSSAG